MGDGHNLDRLRSFPVNDEFPKIALDRTHLFE
jgi:hypothetical protein